MPHAIIRCSVLCVLLIAAVLKANHVAAVQSPLVLLDRMSRVFRAVWMRFAPWASIAMECRDRETTNCALPNSKKP